MSECEHHFVYQPDGRFLCSKCSAIKTYNRDPWEKLYSEKEELARYKLRVQRHCDHSLHTTSVTETGDTITICDVCEKTF